jgi:cardiolipin synthase
VQLLDALADYWGEIVLFAHWAILIGFSIRVISKRRQVGVALAWLAVIAAVPFFGAAVYLLFGEKWLPRRALQRAARINPRLTAWQKDLCERSAVDWTELNADAEPLHRQALATVGLPGIAGNRLTLLQDFESIFDALIADIDGAQGSCHLEFYIWHDGGRADDVAEALMRARKRGVACRVLVDAFGSGGFVGGAMRRRMEEHGVEVAVALPPRFPLIGRLDLRNHRKVVVIDGEIAYTGSQNLVDPRYFKQKANVGQWIDVMVRLEGPGVEALAGLFVHDWSIITGVDPDTVRDTVRRPTRQGATVVQAMPSGPAYHGEAIRQLLLTMVYAARRELILTTPYFVPDDAIETALESAAQRGVDVTLVVPKRIDSRLVRYASPAHFEDLLEAGVRIKRFRGGLLHSKTITVDKSFGLVGTVNLDMRSLWLNFEISLLVYDRGFTTELRDVQLGYVEESDPVDLETWRRRPAARRLLENAAGLLSPLL